MPRISRASRNFIIAYILLVGLPLLGLVAVLKTGRKVAAPISVSGEWKLETQVAPVSAPCGQFLASFQNSNMTLSQSGKGLVVSSSVSSTSSGQGTIDGATVKGVIPLTNAAAFGQACGNNVAFIANLNLNAQPREMSGSIALDNCPSCMAVAFRAVRQDEAVKREAH